MSQFWYALKYLDPNVKYVFVMKVLQMEKLLGFKV